MRTRGGNNKEGGSLLRERWRWLGHPGFLVGVLILAVNDHLLKELYPGWVTGKLSDIAGVAVVGVVASVLIGPRKGLAITGAGFIALKTVPYIAEIASPILGGVTVRDTSDLVALLALLPLWFMLKTPGEDRSRCAPKRHEVDSSIRERIRAGFAVALPILGAAAAMVSATATSCSPQSAVTVVRADHGALVAEVSNGYHRPDRAVSVDGGLTWALTTPAAGTTPTTVAMYDDPDVTGQTVGCSVDGTCWRIRDRRVIERQTPGSNWVEEYRLSDTEFKAISAGCTGGQVGVLSSIAVADNEQGTQVAASLGANGVVARQNDGHWSRQRVLSAPPEPVRAPDRGLLDLLFLFGPICVLVLLIGRRWLPGWRAGIVVVGLGWVTTILAGSALEIITDTGDTVVVFGRVGAVGMLVTAIAAFVVSRRPRKKGAPAAGGQATDGPED